NQSAPVTLASLTFAPAGGTPALGGSAAVTVGGPLVWDGGVMDGTGTTTTNGPVSVGFGATLRRTFNANGATMHSANVTLNLDGGTWNNQSGAGYTFDNGTNIGSSISGTGTFNNNSGATFTKTGDAQAFIT